jgi:hypothetical protein
VAGTGAGGAAGRAAEDLASGFIATRSFVDTRSARLGNFAASNPFGASGVLTMSAMLEKEVAIVDPRVDAYDGELDSVNGSGGALSGAFSTARVLPAETNAVPNSDGNVRTMIRSTAVARPRVCRKQRMTRAGTLALGMRCKVEFFGIEFLPTYLAKGTARRITKMKGCQKNGCKMLNLYASTGQDFFRAR